MLSQRGKLVVLQPEVEGQANAEVLESHGREMTAMCDDGCGWLAMANEGGDVCVWAAESPAPTDAATTDGAALGSGTVTEALCGSGRLTALRGVVGSGGVAQCFLTAAPSGLVHEQCAPWGQTPTTTRRRRLRWRRVR